MSASSYVHLYKTPEWRRLAAVQLRRHPLCAFHLKLGERVKARIADHVRPHRGDPRLFFDPYNLQSLCKHCHDSAKKVHETRNVTRIGVDGWPIKEDET